MVRKIDILSLNLGGEGVNQSVMNRFGPSVGKIEDHKKASHFQCFCTGCGKLVGNRFEPLCTRCGSMVDVAYETDHAQLYATENPYLRFRELLPVRDSELLPQTANYTPTVHATRLGNHIGIPELYLKDETCFETRSTKERMAAVALAYLYECGVRDFCTSSTGNSSTAYAQAISGFPGMTLYLFTAEKFRSRVQYPETDQVRHFVLRDASFVDAFEFARVYADQHGYVTERGFFNLGRREGLKLAWLEASEQVPGEIDWYVQAVSSAMGVYGTYKAAKELYAMGRSKQTPHLLCVQQASCAPMANAWNDGVETIGPQHIVSKPEGIAAAILRGNPSRTYPHVQRIVRESGGHIQAVDEDEIRLARRLVEDLEGLSPCFSASTAVAGLIRAAAEGRITRNHRILVNLTGGDRRSGKASGNPEWYVPSGDTWVPV